jgi:hypothetical protein
VETERLAGHVSETGDDVEHTVRNAGLGGELGDPQCGEGRQLRWLDHHRVPGGERRPDLPRQHGHREVPRKHATDDADGFTDDQPDVVGVGG